MGLRRGKSPALDAVPTSTSTSDPTPDPSFESPPRVSRGIFSPPPDPPDPAARSHSRSLFESTNNNNNNNNNKARDSRPRHHDEYDDDSVDERDTSKCIFKSFFAILIIGMAGYLTWKFGLDSPDTWTEAKDAAMDMIQNVGDKIAEWDLANFTEVLDGLDDISFGDLFGGDPMLGDNVTIPWEDDFVDPSNGGLQLTLQNALDDTWQSEFEAAVSDWSESDALVLTTQRVAVDYNCNPVDGVMVVCNANFGATGWVGINENSIMRNTIVGSVAKMNEYYLRNADFDHRRFTMCHEIGHGKRYTFFSKHCLLNGRSFSTFSVSFSLYDKLNHIILYTNPFFTKKKHPSHPSHQIVA